VELKHVTSCEVWRSWWKWEPSWTERRTNCRPLPRQH